MPIPILFLSLLSRLTRRLLTYRGAGPVHRCRHAGPAPLRRAENSASRNV